jgi:hypothetical protein
MPPRAKKKSASSKAAELAAAPEPTVKVKKQKKGQPPSGFLTCPVPDCMYHRHSDIRVAMRYLIGSFSPSTKESESTALFKNLNQLALHALCVHPELNVEEFLRTASTIEQLRTLGIVIQLMPTFDTDPWEVIPWPRTDDSVEFFKQLENRRFLIVCRCCKEGTQMPATA